MTDHILLETARNSGNVPGWIFISVIVPYFFLIHLGILVWLVTCFIKLVKRDFSFRISSAKIVTLVYGGGVGWLLPFLEKTYKGYDAPTLAVYGNLPALFIAANVENEGLKFYAPYVIFGLIGGWGLGQLIDGAIRLVRKKRAGRGIANVQS